jgi:hypothetical protein
MIFLETKVGIDSSLSLPDSPADGQGMDSGIVLNRVVLRNAVLAFARNDLVGSHLFSCELMENVGYPFP